MNSSDCLLGVCLGRAAPVEDTATGIACVDHARKLFLCVNWFLVFALQERKTPAFQGHHKSALHERKVASVLLVSHDQEADDHNNPVHVVGDD